MMVSAPLSNLLRVKVSAATSLAPADELFVAEGSKYPDMSSLRLRDLVDGLCARRRAGMIHEL